MRVAALIAEMVPPRPPATAVEKRYGWTRFGWSTVLLAAVLAWSRVAGADASTATSLTSLRVGVHANAPLLHLVDGEAVEGFIHDMLDRIAILAGWRLEIVRCDWPDCLRLLEAGDLDLLTPIAYNQTRARRFDFTRENLVVNWARIYRRTDVPVASILDLRGRRVAVVEDDIHYAHLRELDRDFELGIEYLERGGYDALLEAVASGDAEFGLFNRLFRAERGAAYGVEPTGVVFRPVPIRIALPKGRADNPALVAVLDRELRALKAAPDSLYYQSMERWLGEMAARTGTNWTPHILVGAAALAIVLGLIGLRRRGRARGRDAAARRTGRMARTLVLGEDQLREIDTEMRLAATAFETHDGIMVTDERGHILRVNSAFTEVTGYRADEVLGKTPALLKSGRQDARFYRAMWSSLRKQGHWQGEIWNRRKNGELYPEWLRISAVRNPANQLTHYVGIFTDFSENDAHRRIIERQVAEERALGALLRLSLDSLSMGAYLQQGLDAMLELVPWLGTARGGAIFLAPGFARSLTPNLTAGPEGQDAGPIAKRDLAPEAERRYASPHYRQCLYDKAVEADDPLFVGPEVDCGGTATGASHGRYVVPILGDGELLGMLILELPPRHRQKNYEMVFLRRVADAFSIGMLRRRSVDEIEQLAYYDPLTELGNRRLVLERLEHDLQMARRHGGVGAVLFFDLDRFKTFNDALGHAAGDRLLREVASRLKREARSEDTIARVGGDEFAVVAGTLSRDLKQAVFEARRAAQRLCDALGRPYDIEGHGHPLGISVGIALFPDGDAGAAEVVNHADTAMYRAKREDGENIRFFAPEMQTEADLRLRLEKELRVALAEDEFRLYLQPQVDAAGRTVGAEALLRWQHPRRGLVLPGEFISVAEEMGLILGIGHWVLHRSCAAMGGWLRSPGAAAGLRHLSVNVSPLQFRQADFVDRVERILRETELDAKYLVLELTEGMLVDDVQGVIEKMHGLKQLGVGLAIDDFGTGYSSLAYLKRLPLDTLKIDRSFVHDVASDPNDAAIVQTILAMAEHLGLNCVAEGVATREELAFLVDAGCDLYQGFFCGRPMPVASFDALMRRQARGGAQAVPGIGAA